MAIKIVHDLDKVT